MISSRSTEKKNTPLSRQPLCLLALPEGDRSHVVYLQEVQEEEQSEEHSASIPQLNSLWFQQQKQQLKAMRFHTENR